ncbi:FAD-binding oxidoreductase, partial [Candidatus Bathyarchaeota archaeon]|nr:FAD-binding oxidoreductase [Candidatus Bathyarchaeota archaeon]
TRKMPRYQDITPELRKRIEGIVGADNVSTKPDDVEKHAVDESPLEPHRPQLVVKPRTKEEVSEVLKLANSNHVTVTPQGSLTGLSGASHPVFGGIALSLERMNAIVEIDEDNLMAVVEPGVLISEIHEATEKLGLYYPPDPGQESGSIGGNISTNAGGMRAMKYGVTRDFINGLEVVLTDGTIIEVGGKNVKDSTGYSLIDLIIGSEGTLGVVTKATLRLVPKPKLTALIYAPFTSTIDAANAVKEIIHHKIIPFGLEYMQQHTVLTVEKYLEKKVMPDNTHPAYLLVAVEADTKEELDRQLETAGEICIEMGAVDAYIADTASRQQLIWEGRKAVFDAYLALHTVDEADVCIPRNRIPEYVERAEAIGIKHGVMLVPVGHAGDGNLHYEIIKLEETTEDEWPTKMEAALSDLIDLSLEMGGTISGEHGLGYTKKHYLEREVGPRQIELMKGIKAAFDPNGILNPGKVWP